MRNTRRKLFGVLNPDFIYTLVTLSTSGATKLSFKNGNYADIVVFDIQAGTTSVVATLTADNINAINNSNNPPQFVNIGSDITITSITMEAPTSAKKKENAQIETA